MIVYQPPAAAKVIPVVDFAGSFSPSREDRQSVAYNVHKACRDIGFNGPFVIESFTNKVKSIARAAAIWRNFASTQDALIEVRALTGDSG